MQQHRGFCFVFAMEHNFLLSNDIIAYVKMICNMHIMRIIFAVSILVFWVSSNSVTVQPCISYIHKPASELSVAALQLMFTHFRNERLFYHKKVLNNTMNKLIVLPIIFLWLNCYRNNIIGNCETIIICDQVVQLAQYIISFAFI